MSRSFNHVTLVGNLTRDPEIRATSGGDEFCRFSLAVNYSYRTADGEQVDRVDFIDISVWGGLVSVVQNYCHKGKQILVSGKLRSSSWEQDGQKRTKLEVRADNILLLGSGGGAGQSSESTSSQSKSSTSATKSKKEEEDFELDDDYDYNQEGVNPEDIPF